MQIHAVLLLSDVRCIARGSFRSATFEQFFQLYRLNPVPGKSGLDEKARFEILIEHKGCGQRGHVPGFRGGAPWIEQHGKFQRYFLQKAAQARLWIVHGNHENLYFGAGAVREPLQGWQLFFARCAPSGKEVHEYDWAFLGTERNAATLNIPQDEGWL
jgi:hypothetical protein